MSRWFRMYDRVVDDPKVQRLPAEEFRRALRAAMHGQKNEFTPFLRLGSDRPSAHVWRELRSAVFNRDDYRCSYCGARGGRLECDHVIPVAKGGGNDIENLTTSCFSCNRSKRDKLVEEWRQ